MRRVIALICVCLLLAAAEPAFAQQRMFALTTQEIVEVDTSLSSLGRVIQRAPAPYRTLGAPGPVSAAGGALLAWIARTELVLFDTRSGSLQQYTLPAFNGRILGTTADSFSVLVLVWGQLNGVQPGHTAVLFADVRHGTVRMLDLGANVDDVLYVPKRDVLFVKTSTGLVEVRRAADGSLLKTLSITPGRLYRLVGVGATGTRLFVNAQVQGADDYELLAFDVVSGALLARGPRNPYLYLEMKLDEHRRRLLIEIGAGPAAGFEPFIAALSMDTLQFIGRVDLAARPPGLFADVELDVSDRSATIYAVESVYAYTFSDPLPFCKPSTLVAMHVDTGVVRKAVDFTAVTGTENCIMRLVRVTEPAVPSGLSASVTGRSVSLSWGAEAATHYELEAGTAPGLANLATIPVSDTQIVVDGVPPGTYHLRVRAINTIGASLPSREITITVP